MTDWNKILNWRLLAGSHKFPGPDGGTCINEAAIVAAGFPYKSVSSARDCPPCFSRALSAYAIALNDKLPDDVRQSLLMPFVTRLAGTADTPKIERKRFDHIMVGMIREVLPIPLHGWRDDLADQLAAVTNYDEAITAVDNLARALDLAGVRALDLALDLARARALDREIYTAQIRLLDEATKIGRQADVIEKSLVVTRLAQIRSLAPQQ